MLTYPQARNALFKKHILTISLGFFFYPTAWAAPASNALPVLGNIGAGSANVTRSITQGKLTVNQQTDKLIANWNSFNVGENAQVIFNQPATSSIALNRIGSTAASQIFGQVTANGKLILVNPAGITIGSGGQISASSVIASTLNISDSDFNAGNLIFERGTATGAIDNQGAIQSINGTALLAPAIKNSGSLSASNGNVNLANGNRLTSNGITISLSQASSIPSLIQNTGTLQAERISGSNGRVYILGDRYRTGSKVDLAGTINASTSNIKGKQINVTGQLDSPNSLALDAVDNINVNGIINISNASQLLSLSHGAKTGDGYYLNDTAKINLTGSGTGFRVNGNDYNVIRNINELQAIGTISANLNGKYVLGNDIDASATASWNAGKGFKPIGGNLPAGTTSPLFYFSGTFDGLGHSINQLSINRSNQDYVGLFGAAKNASINNTHLNEVNIFANDYAGALVGYHLVNSGLSNIQNNHISGTIDGRANSEFTSRGIGGLIGYSSINNASASISRNISNANVSGYFFAGGLIGSTNSDNNSSLYIQNNTVQGKVTAVSLAGGLIASNSTKNGSALKLESNTVSSTVKSYNMLGEDFPGIFGGLIGQNSVGHLGSILNLSNNKILGNIEAGNMNTGGLLGANTVDRGGTLNIDNNLVSGNVLANYFSYGPAEEGDAVGGLIGFSYIAGISNLHHNIVSGNVVSSNDKVGGLIGYSAIRPDGKLNIVDNTVSNTISGKEYTGGLIGQLISETSIVNIKSNDVSGTVKGTDYTGGLIGKSDNEHGISLSISKNNISNNVTGRWYTGGMFGQLNLRNGFTTINNSSVTGNIEGASYTGGLIGQANLSYAGTSTIPRLNISNSYTTGNVSGAHFLGGLLGSSHVSAGNLLIGNTFSSGNINAIGARVGGLIGESITDAYAISRIFNSYATGAVSGTRSTGGLIGYKNGLGSLQVNRSFWDLNSTGQPASIGGTGLSSEQMKQLSTYVGWNINSDPMGNSIWYINDGVSAPTLR